MLQSLHSRARRPVFAAPDDALAFDDDTVVVPSPRIDGRVAAFFSAADRSDRSEMHKTLKEIVDLNRADHSAAGVPVYAHDPLPESFVDRLVAPLTKLPEPARKKAFDAILGTVEASTRQQVAQQLTARAAQLASPGGGVPLSAQKVSIDDDPAARKRADDLDARDPLAAAAHGPAYAFDSAADDLVGEDGLFGDWGWRRSVPRPSDPVSQAVGDATRLYLEMGPPVAVLGSAAKAGSRLKSRLARMSTDAVVSGGLSVAAEWAAHRGKPAGEQPSSTDYMITFFGGVGSGLTNPKRGKAITDAAWAMGTSLATDMAGGKSLSMPRALGAGLGAYLISKLGGAVERAGLGAQGFGRIVRKFGEKYIRQFLTEFFGSEFELSPQEQRELWEGFQAFWAQRSGPVPQ